MALRDQEYRAIVHRALAALRNVPGVHSVGIGGREKGGRPTGEIVLKVFVSAKLSRAELSAIEIVPAVLEGMATDVVESPSPRAAALVPGSPLGGPYPEDSGRYRPLRGGIQLAGENCFGRGTLGFIARVDEPPPERIVAVTTHHSLFSSVHVEQVDMRVGQPTGDDSSTKCCSGIFGKFIKGYRLATMDAAIIRIAAKTEYYPQIEDIGVLNSDHQVTSTEAGTLTYPVRKRGRTTLVTGGTIQAIHATHASGAPDNYMVIKPNPLTGGGIATFCDWGDSGAAVVNDANEVVGLLFGAAALRAGKPQAGWGFAWAIQDVFAQFAADGIDLIVSSGSTLNEKRTVLVRPEDQAEGIVPPAGPAIMAHKIEADLESIQLGQELVTLWMRHSAELNQLVNGNRRVATRWYRLGGASLLQCALRSVYSDGIPVPETISGRPADECLHDVLTLFDTHGSPRLRRDIRANRERLPRVAGRTYREIVEALRNVPQGSEPCRD